MSQVPGTTVPALSHAPTVLLASPARRELWLHALMLTLLGYAVLGKGWAYVGYPPLFIGEVLLAGGAAALVFSRLRGMPRAFPSIALLTMMAWGALRTIPYLSSFGIDAVRDAVIWGYGAFAFITFWYIAARPHRLALVLRRYAQFAGIFLVAMPAAWALRFVLADAMPRWPWADVGIIDPKAGDVMVHLSGILAFWIAGIRGEVGAGRLLLLAACAGVIGSYERAGMVAFLLCFAVCAILRPHRGQLHRLAAVVVIGLVVLAVTAIRLEAPSRGEAKTREISFEQFVANVLSLTSSTELGDLDNTRTWRLEWWHDIADYTLRGPYFWQGKGFGINLADDDGYQVKSDGSLRSPHSAHLTMLARAGVPGLALWAAVQLSWAAAIFRCYLGARRSGQSRWSDVFLFLLVYWLAFMANASFDVYMEGPMGGIWFWCIYGLGLGAIWIYQRNPGILVQDADPHLA